MRVRHLHRWELTAAQARSIQEKLCRQVRVEPLTGPIRFVAGADVAYQAPRGPTRGFGGVVVLEWDTMRTVEEASSEQHVTFPYIPGLLSFREAPVLLPALERIGTEVDVVLVDGHGIAHPRGFGLASHIGVLLDKPTVGCAKKPLVGEFPVVGEQRGEWVTVHLDGRAVGAAVRTRKGVRPVFVSIGHRIDLEGAVQVVLHTSRRYRLPEPVRQAHRLVSEARRRKIA